MTEFEKIKCNMEESVEIENLEHIQLLVDTFYGKIRKDDLLADIFNDIIQNRWPEHLEKMYRFWQTILLGEHTYTGRPLLPHLPLPVEKMHFERWIYLFEQTLDELFHGEKLELARWQANRMAMMFNMKIDYYKQSQLNNP